MSQERHRVARFFGFLWPLCYVVFAAVVGTVAIVRFRNGDAQSGWLYVILTAIAIYMLWNSVKRWGQIAEKYKPKKD